MERALIGDYYATISKLLTTLNADNYDIAVQIAEIPEHIRGYGHVKEKHVKEAKIQQAELLEKFANPNVGKKEIRIKVAA
jgi:indolepyruvate ferredoxin oxidoreductase